MSEALNYLVAFFLFGMALHFGGAITYNRDSDSLLHSPFFNIADFLLSVCFAGAGYVLLSGIKPGMAVEILLAGVAFAAVSMIAGSKARRWKEI